DNWQNGTS
nr:Chain B, OMP32 [Delftia acidovorans]2FGR_B Chain B, Pap [synthetic construct]